MPHMPATTADVRAARETGRKMILDVLPPEHFGARRIPGAQNACVYEVNFLDQAAALAPDRKTPIILYGAGEGSLDAVTAAGKLHRAGYSDIAILQGGLPAWEAEGNPLEGTDPEAQEPPHPVLVLRNSRYAALTEESTVLWTGRNYNGRHWGTVSIKEGSLIREGEGLKGIFTLSMDSIANADLAGTEMQCVLEDHLKSDDFFFVSHFPTRVRAVMTLRGVARDIAFDANLRPLADGRIVLMANLDLDRTAWGVIYGSARFFKYLSYHIVYDLVSVDLRVVLE
jgi:rhodanese-related sulfurtransferase